MINTNSIKIIVGSSSSKINNKKIKNIIDIKNNKKIYVSISTPDEIKNFMMKYKIKCKTYAYSGRYHRLIIINHPEKIIHPSQYLEFTQSIVELYKYHHHDIVLLTWNSEFIRIISCNIMLGVNKYTKEQKEEFEKKYGIEYPVDIKYIEITEYINNNWVNCEIDKYGNIKVDLLDEEIHKINRLTDTFYYEHIEEENEGDIY